MTHKQRMLDAIKGEPIDHLPWVPRLDLWYRANRRAGTLPAPYGEATLREIVDDLDMGYHAVIPDFRDLHAPEDDIDRGIGVYNLRMMPYRTIFDRVQRKVQVSGDVTRVEYQTPVGSVHTAVLYDEAMRAAGISITHVAEHAIKTPDDIKAVGYLFANAHAVPNYAGYQAFADEIGDRGIAVGFVSLAASPLHLIQRELMPLDEFFFALNDYPEEMAWLVEQIAGYWERVLQVAVDCPADVLLVGANYDASVTFPPFFAEHIHPWLRRYADALHARGKYLLTHTDGENTGLLDCYLESGFDIADSICPSPMTKLTMRQVRDTFAGRIAILGGIPSVSLLPSVMPDDDFAEFLGDFFTQIGTGARLILGISDTTPPGADFHRLLEIGERAKAFRP